MKPIRSVVRRVAWFSVPAGIGCLPLVGSLGVPVLDMLPAFCPTSLLELLVSSAAILAGVIGVLLCPQTNRRPRVSLPLIRVAAVCAVAGVVSLIVLNVVFVERVYISAEQVTASYIVGPGTTVTRDCEGCQVGMTNSECIGKWDLVDAEASGCWWTDNQLMWMKLWFSGSYLLAALGATTTIGGGVAGRAAHA